MATIKLFAVEYHIVKANSNPPPGGQPAWLKRESHHVTCAAASGHPADILTVLNANLTIPSGYTLELVNVKPVPGHGTEGNVVYS